MLANAVSQADQAVGPPESRKLSAVKRLFVREAGLGPIRGLQARKARSQQGVPDHPRNPESLADTDLPIQSVWKRYSYIWLTLGLFVFSLVGHLLFGWLAYVDEQQTHGQPIEVSGYTIEMLRDTFENWQSEFLQLMWQVGGLALFLYIGSPQSKEGSDRVEAKIDAILRSVEPPNADEEIEQLDRA
jgi:hypothetical protein